MVVAIVQARMTSTRLPGKVLMDIAGQPMLWHVVHRLRRAKRIDEVVVSTSDKQSSNVIVDFCQTRNISYFRGSEEDVLDRYYQTARSIGAKTIVRVTSDCPLIDPTVVDDVISIFQSVKFDFVANNFKRTYPNGMDTEVFSFSTLEQASHEATDPFHREHVSPYIRLSGRFSLFNVANDVDFSGRNYHWSVDQVEDLEFVRHVFESLPESMDFSMADIVTLLETRPEIQRRSA